MKIYQIIKRVNNTELGKGNTHETYLRLPTNIDGNLIFNNEKKLKFSEKRNLNNKHEFSYTCGRENRFNGFGPFYRNNGIDAGDEVIIERIEDGTNNSYYVDYHHYDNILVLLFEKPKGNKRGFELLTENRSKLIQKINSHDNFSLEIIFKGKKRVDSPNETCYYDLKINDKSYFDICNEEYKFKSKDLLELYYFNDILIINEVNPFILNEFEVDL